MIYHLKRALLSRFRGGPMVPRLTAVSFRSLSSHVAEAAQGERPLREGMF